MEKARNATGSQSDTHDSNSKNSNEVQLLSKEEFTRQSERDTMLPSLETQIAYEHNKAGSEIISEEEMRMEGCGTHMEPRLRGEATEFCISSQSLTIPIVAKIIFCNVKFKISIQTNFASLGNTGTSAIPKEI